MWHDNRMLISLSAKTDYTLLISRCIATARERIPGSIGNYVTECSQQRGNLKDDGYMHIRLFCVLRRDSNGSHSH